MLRGYNTAAAGMISQQRRQDVLSNNLANALTPGYKADQTTLRAFPELLIQRQSAEQIPVQHSVKIPSNKLLGSINTGVYMQETIPSFEQGDVQQTGMNTDVALWNGQLPDENGFLFFTVQNENGETSYTRNGNFTIDEQGYLVTNSGYYVLDENQNRIQPNHDQFSVTKDGQIRVDGNTIPLGITYHPNATELTKGNNDLYQLENGQAIENARNVAGVTFEVQQGMLERSNVDTAATMTSMMQTFRNFEMNQQVLKAFDQSMDIAVNQIGKLR
ncbi:flagellar hook-basal body protein [Salinibacillus xinjiangensis]|uniref:Flagellar hook-basal body complex protein n=1 Tax=Salinibacillus xinjiangensis TaxID=1229268 RepID=A0A6G1X5F5_9BACI|nr:flagellar hook-basal body protein [Salinibacillus xinjiangensis]MRG86172.1 flagellar hook-basal body complex protein [Salinibacillus xinjiangensis]